MAGALILFSLQICAMEVEQAHEMQPTYDEQDYARDVPLLRRVLSCHLNRTSLLEEVLRNRATIMRDPEDGSTILMNAIFQMDNAEWNPAVGVRIYNVRQLLAYKNSMKLINCKDKDGNTALGWALHNLDYCIIKNDCIAKNSWSKEEQEERVGTKEAIEIVNLLLAHGENSSLLRGNWATEACQHIEMTNYKSLLRYIPQRHQQFKNDCADRLASFLMLGGEKNGSKVNEDLAYGPFPRDIAHEIANKRWDSDEN